MRASLCAAPFLMGATPAEDSAWQVFVLDVLRWVESQGPEAIVWIVVLQALMVVLSIPGPFFTLAAGFLFGLWGGLAVAVVGSTLGSMAAYGLAQFFPREKVLAWSRRRKPLRLLEDFVREGGWRVVLATRLIPLFPFKLSNYFFGWMRFPFTAFVAGTFLGIIPMTLVSVSVGSLASDMASALHPTGAARTGWIISLGGLAAGVALFVYTGLQAKRKLRGFSGGAAAAESGKLSVGAGRTPYGTAMPAAQVETFATPAREAEKPAGPEEKGSRVGVPSKGAS